MLLQNIYYEHYTRIAYSIKEGDTPSTKEIDTPKSPYSGKNMQSF